MLKKMTEICHDLLKDSCREGSIGIDFTCGQGNDTLFLSQYCKHVYAYDIQEEAIIQTKELCANCEHVTILHKSHDTFDEEVSSFDVGVFNFGYLPGSNQLVTTTFETSLNAVRKALDHLNKKGLLVLVLYIGHDAGKQEAKCLEEFVTSLSSHSYNCMKIAMLNKANAPYICAIEKIR